jgi:hypothetical protein
MFKKPENWGKLPPEERRTIRLDYWESGEWIDFKGTEAAQQYKTKVRILRDAVELKKGSRVPVVPTIGGYLLKRAGLSGTPFMAMNPYQSQSLIFTMSSILTRPYCR